MSMQPEKSAKNTKKPEVVNESWFFPDSQSLQKQQDEHNRKFDLEKSLGAVLSLMDEMKAYGRLSQEAERTQPLPSGEVSALMEEFGVDRQTAEKWADMI